MLIRHTKNEKLIYDYDESIQLFNMYYFDFFKRLNESHQKFIKNSNNFEIVIFINKYPNDSIRKYVKISKKPFEANNIYYVYIFGDVHISTQFFIN